MGKNLTYLRINFNAAHPEAYQQVMGCSEESFNSVIDTTRKLFPKRKITVVFQPHLFTRTRDFYKDFSIALNKSDIIIITDIYPAREKPIKGINSRIIIKELEKNRHKNVHYIPDSLSLPIFIKNIALANDIILIMGAGNIWRICENIYKEIK